MASEAPPPYSSQGYGTSSAPSQPGQDAGKGTHPPYPPPQGYGTQPGYGTGGGYQQYGAPSTTTTYITQPVTTTSVLVLRDYPVHITCPRCSANVVTTISYSDGLAVWLIAFLIFIFGGFLGCCLIPFCITGLKDVTHACPNCGLIIGHYRRL